MCIILYKRGNYIGTICVLQIQYTGPKPLAWARLTNLYTNISPQIQGGEDEANWSLDIRSRRQLGGWALVKISVGWSIEEIQPKITFHEILMSHMAVNFNVLGVIMEDIIISNINSTAIITTKRSLSELWSIQVSHEPSKPEKLTNDANKGMILNYSVVMKNNILLLATPWDKRGTMSMPHSLWPPRKAMHALHLRG